ncbi:MAG TPA: T9SS type A sorting domain-containing protein [Flavobacterium sp.]|jgi:hypothetical protein
MKYLNQTNLLRFAVFMMLGASATAQNNNKVTICHVPPGNPANAHTISISPNAVQAHIPGNNQHSDFYGPCWSGCTGMTVISYVQGKQSDGTPVAADRSNVSKVLGEPDGANTPGEFFTLGFGGHIIIKMNGGVLNRPGNDLRIYETTFDYLCPTYPERANIFVSKDMNSWTSVGTLCQDGEIDIAPLDWIQYVKIVDITDKTKFNQVVDAFDVDGIKCINMPSSRRAEDAVEVAHLVVYPNPVTDNFSINFEHMQPKENVLIEIIDMLGRTVYSKKVVLENADETVVVPTSELPTGVHNVRVTSESLNYTQQLVKK